MNKKTLPLFLSKKWIIIFILLSFSIEGVLVAGAVLGGRHPGGKYFLSTGLTLKTFLLFSAAIGVVFLCAGLIQLLLANPDLLKRVILQLPDRVRPLGFVLISVLFLVSLQDILYLLTPPSKPNPIFTEYHLLLVSLLPFLTWGVLASLQLSLLVGTVFPKPKGLSPQEKHKFWIVGTMFLILFLLWLVLAYTDLGFIPGTSIYELRKQVGRFLPVTNPILARQVVLSSLLLLALRAISNWFSGKWEKLSRIVQSPILIGLLIWIIAFLAWSSVSIEQNYLVDFPDVPSGVIYPNSDAFYFAKESQRFSLGEGFGVETTHVLYSLFLSLIRWIGGESYQSIARLQILVVGLVPVLLFFLTEKLHSRFSGLLVAALFIIRERNGLLLGNELAGPVSNVLLSENLSTLGMIAYLYVFSLWLDDPEKRKFHPWIAGGVMGVSLLIRADFAAGLLASCLVGLIVLWKKKAVWLRGVFAIFATVGLIIIPWMFRNWSLTGDIYLDKRNVMQTKLSQYLEEVLYPASEENGSPVVGSGTGTGEEGWEQEYQFGAEKDSPRKEADQISGNSATPGSDQYSKGYLYALLNHFLNNIQQSFLYLPNNFQPLFGFGPLLLESSPAKFIFRDLYTQKYTENLLNVAIDSSPYYWFKWNGRGASSSVIPVALVLFLISAGVVFTIKNQTHRVLTYCAVLLTHSLIWSVARFSGNRFIKSVDWIVLIFFCVGLVELVVLGFDKFGLNPALIHRESEFRGIPDDQKLSVSRQLGIGNALIIICLVFIGWSPTILENRIHENFPITSLNEILSKVDTAGTVYWNDCQEEVAKAENGGVFYGSAIYPRFYSADEVHGNDRRNIPQDPSISRAGFYLIGTENMGVLLENASQKAILPHQAEVIVLGDLIDGSYINGFCLFQVDRSADQIHLENRYRTGGPPSSD